MSRFKMDETEFYNISDEVFFCCEERQFVTYCKAHGEWMGCQFCTFDPDSQCDCEQ